MASAFVRKALEMAAQGLIPAERGPMMAIGVAAQFETMLRQKDIIGEWAPYDPTARRRPTFVIGAEMLDGRFHLGAHPGLALAHEDVQEQVPRSG